MRALSQKPAFLGELSIQELSKECISVYYLQSESIYQDLIGILACFPLLISPRQHENPIW